MAFLAMLMIAGASSCSKDSEPEYNPDEPLIGTWQAVSFYGQVKPYKRTFQFKSNGTLIYSINVDGRLHKEQGTWSATEDQLTTELYDEEDDYMERETQYYRVSKSYLYLYESYKDYTTDEDGDSEDKTIFKRI